MLIVGMLLVNSGLTYYKTRSTRTTEAQLSKVQNPQAQIAGIFIPVSIRNQIIGGKP